MAVDRKADYVGTHGGSYTDINGVSKQFTYVDHDKKTKVSTQRKESLSDIQSSIKSHTIRTVKAILAMPAVNAVRNKDGLYEEFIDRDQANGISWNETAVFDACIINPTLAHNLFNQVWRTTVKEQYWFEDMSYEDVAKGEWKKFS